MRFTAAAFAAALLALAGCASAPYPNSAICRFTPAGGDGLGGTGATSDVLLRLVGAAEERGIGGTGLVAENKEADERGLGGTGIIGIVTGFASICVNGYEVEVTDKTEVTVENLPARLADVRLGQLVEIEAQVEGGRIAASSVNVRMAVAGPVSSVAPDGKTLKVAGQDVAMAGFGGSTPETAPAVGQWVAVSGLRRADNVVAATSLVALPAAGREILVAGTVHANAGVFRVGELAVTGAAAKEGAQIIVRGEIAAGTGTQVAALTALPETMPAFVARVETVSVLGFAGVANANVMSLGNFTTPLNTAMLPGVVQNNLPVRAVQLDGRIVAGVLVPDRLQLMERPRDNAPVFTINRPDLITTTGPNQNIPVRPIDGSPVIILPLRPDLPTGDGVTIIPGRPETPELPINNGTFTVPERPMVETPGGAAAP